MRKVAHNDSFCVIEGSMVGANRVISLMRWPKKDFSLDKTEDDSNGFPVVLLFFENQLSRKMSVDRIRERMVSRNGGFKASFGRLINEFITQNIVITRDIHKGYKGIVSCLLKKTLEIAYFNLLPLLWLINLVLKSKILLAVIYFYIFM